MKNKQLFRNPGFIIIVMDLQHCYFGAIMPLSDEKYCPVANESSYKRDPLQGVYIANRCGLFGRHSKTLLIHWYFLFLFWILSLQVNKSSFEHFCTNYKIINKAHVIVGVKRDAEEIVDIW